MDRSKKRLGRIVRYNPTAAEVAVNGEGPYAGLIVGVNVDGTVNLNVATPTVTALSATAIVTADADATYGQPEADLINELKNRMDEVLPRLDETSKLSVPEGSGEGTFSFIAGSDAV